MQLKQKNLPYVYILVSLFVVFVKNNSSTESLAERSVGSMCRSNIYLGHFSLLLGMRHGARHWGATWDATPGCDIGLRPHSAPATIGYFHMLLTSDRPKMAQVWTVHGSYS